MLRATHGAGRIIGCKEMDLKGPVLALGSKRVLYPGPAYIIKAHSSGNVFFRHVTIVYDENVFNRMGLLKVYPNFSGLSCETKAFVKLIAT